MYRKFSFSLFLKTCTSVIIRLKTLQYMALISTYILFIVLEEHSQRKKFSKVLSGTVITSLALALHL